MKYQKIIKVITIAIAIAINGYTALAQAEWGKTAMKRYAMFFPGHVPTSHTLSYKWQMRIELGHQLYFKRGIKSDPNMYNYRWVSPQFLGLELRQSRDWRLALSLTPWNKITLGAAFATSYRHFEWIYDNYLEHKAYADHTMDELFASFHDVFGENFAYEARYTFCSSHMKFYSRQYAIPSEIEDELHAIATGIDVLMTYDNFDGMLYSHSVMGGLSAFNRNRSLQGTFQLSTEYMYFGKRSYTYAHLLYDVWRRVLNERGHFQFTPSLLFSYHAKRIISIQAHVSLPIALLDGHLYAPCPALGMQITFRAIKARRSPEAYIEAQ